MENNSQSSTPRPPLPPRPTGTFYEDGLSFKLLIEDILDAFKWLKKLISSVFHLFRS